MQTKIRTDRLTERKLGSRKHVRIKRREKQRKKSVLEK